MKFNEKLRNLRQEKKISQKELSEMIGVSQTAIYQWEKGTRLPKTEQLYKIATILQIEISDLVGEDFSKRILGNLKSIEVMPERLTANLKKANLLNNYDKLNEIGQTEAVKRVKELTEIKRYTVPDYLSVNAAHALDGASEADKQHDEAIMQDPEEWEE